MTTTVTEVKNSLQHLLDDGQFEELREFITSISCQDNEIFEDAEEIIIVADEDSPQQMETVISMSDTSFLEKIQNDVNNLNRKKDKIVDVSSSIKIQKNVNSDRTREVSAHMKIDKDKVGFWRDNDTDIRKKIIGSSPSAKSYKNSDNLNRKRARKKIKDVKTLIRSMSNDSDESSSSLIEKQQSKLKRIRSNLKRSDNSIPDPIPEQSDRSSTELSLELFFRSFSIVMKNFPSDLSGETQNIIAELVSGMESRVFKEKREHSNCKTESRNEILNQALGKVPIDDFFKEITRTVLKFPPTLMAEAKIAICSLMSEMELLAIKKERSKYSATFTYVPS